MIRDSTEGESKIEILNALGDSESPNASPTNPNFKKKAGNFQLSGQLFISTSFEGEEIGEGDAAMESSVKAMMENVENTLEQLQQEKEREIEELLERISGEKIERLADVRGKYDIQIREKELEVRRTNVAKQVPLKAQIE